MNKIVRDHYPVENLPADLREGFGNGQTVRVVVEVESETASGAPPLSDSPNKKNLTVQETLSMIDTYRQSRPADTDMQEAVRRIRELRDEWDDV